MVEEASAGIAVQSEDAGIVRKPDRAIVNDDSIRMAFHESVPLAMIKFRGAEIIAGPDGTRIIDGQTIDGIRSAAVIIGPRLPSVPIGAVERLDLAILIAHPNRHIL